MPFYISMKSFKFSTVSSNKQVQSSYKGLTQ